MTPREILRFATAKSKVDVDLHKRAITIAYINASLHRAKRMPPLKSLIARQSRATLADIMAAMKAGEQEN